MLMPDEWAARLGIVSPVPERSSPPARSAPQWQQTDDPVRMMAGLTMLRWMGVGDQTLYTTNLQRLCGAYSRNPAQFWQELRQKKVGIFGEAASPHGIDPIAIARHPWCMDTDEFKRAWAAVDAGRVPDIPDTRRRVSVVLAGIGGGLRALGNLVPPAAPLAKPASGIAWVAAAVAAAIDWLEGNAENSRFRSQLPALRIAYQKEADYRDREIVPPISV